MINIGSTYNTSNYGKVIVLEKSSRSDFYVVKFIRTGTIKEFRGCHIKNGTIRDPYAKTVCGVACTGNIKTKGKYRVLYSVWHDMIGRCYDPSNKRYEAYKNVSVDESWLVFENFYNDVRKIEGYDEQKIADGILVLDKDLKQRNRTDKIYSKDTCLWISKKENNQIQDNQQRAFTAVSPDGKVYEDCNISRFCREHGLKRRHVSGVLHNRSKTTNGWKFSYKEIV